MDNYIVSARKYRPSTFRSVVGQKSLTVTLKNAIQNNKLAHAYLFCGPRGVGKTSCARIFAKTINCLHPTADGEACNACESCQAFIEQRSYNIHELDAASNNSVDDIRSLIDQVRIPPAIGRYKVFIIDEVHMLSSAAFNAFLKTLEEPPRHALFILATTEKHKVLPTILSRCQIYDFSRISLADMVEHLQYVASCEQVTAEPEALNVIAQKADGGMRDALSIFDQVVSFTNGNITYQAVIDNLNVLDYEYYFRLTEAILAGDVRSAVLTLNEILCKGFDGQNIITGLASHFRDLLVCKDEATLILFEVGASIRERYKEMAKRCSDAFLFKAIELANTCDMNYRQSRNKRLLLELTLIQLCQLNIGPGAGSSVSPAAPASVSSTSSALVSSVAASPASSASGGAVSPMSAGPGTSFSSGVSGPSGMAPGGIVAGRQGGASMPGDSPAFSSSVASSPAGVPPAGASPLAAPDGNSFSSAPPVSNGGGAPSAAMSSGASIAGISEATGAGSLPGAGQSGVPSGSASPGERYGVSAVPGTTRIPVTPPSSQTSPGVATKRTGRPPLGPSLKEMGAEKPAAARQASAAPVQEVTSVFTQEQLTQEWDAFLETIDKKVYLKNTMINCKPVLQDHFYFEVPVHNPGQQEELFNAAIDILTYLRKRLDNTRVQMRVRIIETNEKHLAYTSTEKLEHLLRTNPVLAKLKDEFNLMPD